MEKNNQGFDIEANSDGTWKHVAFVKSQAPDGTSEAMLTYQYLDNAPPKGVTQYRIIQKDFDGKKSYSAIRMVRGAVATGKTQIVPNPNNGTFAVIFDDNKLHDVVVYDVTGRVFKKQYGIKNSMSVSELHKGTFLLKVSSPGATEFKTEKIIVQ